MCHENDTWNVYLLNRNSQLLASILITSRGYGEKGDENQKTSTLRHSIPLLDTGEFALIEPISDTVFHLNNEYWVSYYIEEQIYDKKFIFVPDSILRENMIEIPEMERKGVLHD